MWGHPGKKLLFMGGEFGQWREWNHDASLDWDLTSRPLHAGVQAWVRDLNRMLAASSALHTVDFTPSGFSWIVPSDDAQSVIAFLRHPQSDGPPMLVACNFTPVSRSGYRLGVPRAGEWREVLNSDSALYGGSGMGNMGVVRTDSIGAHGHAQSISLTLPPLAAVFLTHD
jgi:1,4-alpha-glucan branching enzyme